MFPTRIFERKHVLIAITGGIAAYKACELIRYLVTHGAEVRLMMTQTAEKFVTRHTLETLSGNPVYSTLFPDDQSVSTHHVNLADWAEAAIIAPATANMIGKVANGIADDFVSTTVLALHCPVVIAPAMNTNMWNNTAVQRNIRSLRNDNCLICSPEEGFLAEGYSGVGRLARLESLVQYLYRAIHPSPDSLSGKKVLITAARTEEALDPVRFFTNRSTGKMGFAVAIEAFARGAEVVVIYGPTYLTPPGDVEIVKIQNAEEMYDSVHRYIDKADIFVSTAAVADFTPSISAQQKIKKEQASNTIEIRQTKDILSEVGQKKKEGQYFVGFAVETENFEKNAKKKLESKNLDLVVLNNPLEKDSAFASERNKVILLNRAGEKHDLPIQYKLDVAREIFNFLLKPISS